MHYYEHHIGDYDAATAHLSILEDGVYCRLLRLYYRKEQPIPSDMAMACRLIRAISKDERKAVEVVLAEFFTLGADGWRQKRCDVDIERYQKKAERNREVGKLGGRPRKTATQAEPTDNPGGLQAEPTQNPPQEPRTKNQEPIQEIQGRATSSVAARAGPEVETQGHEPTPAGLVCRAIRAAGMADANPGDPRLLELIRQGAAVEEFQAATVDAVAKGKPWGWMLGAVVGKRRDAHAIALAPPIPVGPPWHETRSGIIAKGVELGLGGWDEAEWAAGRAPIFSAYTRQVFKAAGHNERDSA
jgi:uncharacterized protein YdaU (DUF1376 family)